MQNEFNKSFSPSSFKLPLSSDLSGSNELAPLIKKVFVHLTAFPIDLLLYANCSFNYLPQTNFPHQVILYLAEMRAATMPDAHTNEQSVSLSHIGVTPGAIGILELSSSSTQAYPAEQFVIEVENLDTVNNLIVAQVLKPSHFPPAFHRESWQEERLHESEVNNYGSSNLAVQENLLTSSSSTSLPDFLSKSSQAPDLTFTTLKLDSEDPNGQTLNKPEWLDEFEASGNQLLNTTLRSPNYFTYQQFKGKPLEKAPWGSVITLVGLVDLPLSLNLTILGKLRCKIVSLSLADELEINEYLNAVFREGHLLQNTPTHAICFEKKLDSVVLSDLGLSNLQPSKSTSTTLQQAQSVTPSVTFAGTGEAEETLQRLFLRRLLTAFRLFRPGYLGFGLQFYFDPNSIKYTFQDNPSILTPNDTTKFFTNTVDDSANNNGSVQPYSLASSATTIEELQEWITFYVNVAPLIQEESLLGRAISRFERTYQQESLHERITDAVIGLETLLKPDKGPEISYSVGLRASFLVADTLQERLEILTFIKKAYGVRSGLVHTSSKSNKVTEEMAERCQDVLRQCLKRLIRSSNTLLEAFGGGKFKPESLERFYDSLILVSHFDQALQHWQHLYNN